MNACVKMMVVGALLLSAAPALAADDEAALIAALAPQRSAQEKDQACQRLKHVGTAKAVPALAALLTDQQLSHSARYALETIPGDEASAALREALGKTRGATRVGIIESLGARRDRQAVNPLQEALRDTDAAVRVSAAVALGRIGTPPAVAALKAALDDSTRQIGPALIEGLLLGAERLLADGDAKAAFELYSLIYDSQKLEHHRTAAYRGLVLAAGNQAAERVVTALRGNEPAAIHAALQLVREIPGESATRAFAAVLPDVDPRLHVPLLAALEQRGDKAAAPEVLKLASSNSPAVRRAALSALGALGDASNALALAQWAARTTGPEQEAARGALNLIRDPKLCDALLAALPAAQAPVQAEIIRALAARQERHAVPALIRLAQSPGPETRLAALESLATLVDASHVPQLLALLLAADEVAQLSAAERALIAACARADRPQSVVPELLAAMNKPLALAHRVSLLRIVGRQNTPESLAALRSALSDTSPAIQDAALRTLAEFAPLPAASDLLKLATDAQRSTAQRVLALRGYWRLCASASSLSVQDRWQMVQAGMAAASRPEDIRQGLSELARLAHPEALKLALSLAERQPVRTEAQSAAVRIAVALSGSHAPDAKAALKAIEKSPASDAIRAEAAKALGQLDRNAGFITAWSYAGPYRQAGKQCTELFDIPFAPEQAGAQVKWKPLPPAADPALFWQADLLPLADGEQCVVYVKSRVFCPREQPVRLEIGSDDGNKIWLNGKLVHAKNTMRPIEPAQDSATATLQEGWNDLLIKVTQNNMGFAVCVRIREPDGAPVDGLRCAAE